MGVTVVWRLTCEHTTQKAGKVVPQVGSGLRTVPIANNDLTEKPKYDDTLPSALGQLAADIAGAWDNKPTPYKRRRIALLLDELLSLIEADADIQQIFTRLPFALDKGLILQSFYSRVFPPPEPPTEPEPTDVCLRACLENHKITEILPL